ncbi:DNA/RNA non-specific endonuclease [Flammeovirgaceae bacterium SG7u.111]|nr:DNA/RNA non-specific endonuclease [Flammeovirgaceae bacterium SG7u.132]WPO35764.1 DNA/RNA non-specific endonuclease [Flammeovirgaceae bacterium SG7u.111]
MRYILVMLTLISCTQETQHNQGLQKEDSVAVVQTSSPQAAISTTFQESDFNYLPTSTTGIIVKHKNYTLSFSEKFEQAEWVAYEITSTEAAGEYERKGSFRMDELVETETAHDSDYKGSGYDRGHLAPAADLRFTEEAMYESFYFSNISPQTPAFNRGIWKKLEGQVRSWASEYDTLYVITGGILEEGLPTIGENEVAVPKYFYKIVFDVSGSDIKSIAYLMPNMASDEELEYYIVSVDRLEELTGIDFFPALPDSLEDKLEEKSTPDLW